MKIFSPAKVNLFLEINGKEAVNNHHILNSLVAFTKNIGDHLTILPSPSQASNDIKITGPFAHLLPINSKENILYKTKEIFGSTFSLKTNFSIILEKNLPVSAGIGGGSSNAAALLRFLALHYNITNSEIVKICSLIGSDIEACFLAQPCYIQGVSQTKQCYNLPSFDIVLINPGIEISTPDIFRQFAKKPLWDAEMDMKQNFIDKEELIQYLSLRRNSLEPVASALDDSIEIVIKALKQQQDCLLARMSGSGATCFGIFPNQISALNATKSLTKLYPSWWIKYDQIATN